MEDKKKAPDKARPHYEKAEAMLIQSTESPHTSERLRVLDVSGLSLVAVKLGDMVKFKEYLILGAQGAKAMRSDYLLGKTKRAWRAGKKRWPYEDQVAKLAEVLVDDMGV